MNTELFIAKRLFSSKDENQRLSRRVVRLAVAGISLGMVVMILTIAIVTGFQNEIESKVNGFAAHLQIANYDSNKSYQTSPISSNQPFLDELNNIEGIRHVQTYATKPGMINMKNENQGVILKGISSDFDWSFFKKNQIEGEIIPTDSARTDQVWVSKQIASMLKLKLGDKIRMYFLNENEAVPRIRRFKISGIYHTGLEEFDLMFVLVDIRHVQRLNNWQEDQISGFEIYLDDVKDVEEKEYVLRNLVLSHVEENAPLLRVINIKRKFPHIFDWLTILNMNVWIILGLMILVAGFNMISGLLVIILERTQMIGVLKSMGAANLNVRKVFLYLSAFLIGEGLFWGNLLGLILAFIQYQFKIIQLDPVNYYVSTVPINFSALHLIFLNAGALTITMLMLIAPSYFISRIDPGKTIRFE